MTDQWNPQGQQPQQPGSGQPQQPGYPQQPQQQPGYGQPQVPQAPQQQPGYGQPQAPQQPAYAQPQAPQQPAYAQTPQQPGYGQPAPGAQPGGTPKKKPVWPWIVGGVAVVVVGGLIALGFVVAAILNPTGPSIATSQEPLPVETDTVSDPSTESPSPAPSSSTSMGDAFAERDKFIAYQGQIGSDGLITATTPEQKAYIADQKDWVEQNGATWSPQAESFYIAISVDACETAILNGHKVDSTIYDMHVQTEPLFASYQSDPAKLKGATDSMVYGMSYICPDDYPAWQKIWEQKNPK